MPTKTKLLSAVFLAALMGYASVLALEVYPKALPPPFFLEINIAIGSIVGWHILGRSQTPFFTVGLANGFTGVVVSSVLAMAIHGAIQMFRFTRDMRYDDLLEAVTGVLIEGLELAQMVYTPQLLAVLFGGGLVIGFILQQIYRRFGA